ncbi:hypothetical protein V6N12_034569 [Hibiscus sabdariffa]|uniref:Retrotransposon gag domain-containing protein n=1 Tax=Hibiscus sabdariffa TaxID=183260 RepID=A0ABR2DHJ3_9ROSI
MGDNNSHDQNPREGQNQHASAGGLVNPSIPLVHQEQIVIMVRDYLAEDLEGLNPVVNISEFEAEHFELKLIIFSMLNTLGQFGGSLHENARDKTKAWLDHFTPGLLQTWIDLCRSFLARFSHNNMIDKLRNEITSFRQEDDESMYEA